jgi:hypothetical protein
MTKSFKNFLDAKYSLSLLEDELFQSYNNVLQHLCSLERDVIFIATEYVPCALCDRVSVIDLVGANFDEVSKVFMDSLEQSKDAILVVQNLGVHLYSKSTKELARFLDTIRKALQEKPGVSVVMGIHIDTVEDPGALKFIESYFDVACRVKNLQRFLDSHSGFQYVDFVSKEKRNENIVDPLDNAAIFLCEFEVCKMDAKYVREDIIVTTDENGYINTSNLSTLTDYFQAEKAKKAQKKEEPKHEVTFNVSINEQQAKDREGVILPYMRTQDEGSEKKSNVANMAIHYVPDADDDFDDEDPDADLEI